MKLNKRYQKMVLVFSRVSVGIKLSGDAEQVPDLSSSSISMSLMSKYLFNVVVCTLDFNSEVMSPQWC